MSINHSSQSHVIRIVIEDEKLLRSNENLFFCTFMSNDRLIDSPIPIRAMSKADCLEQGKKVLTFPIKVREFSNNLDSFFEQSKNFKTLNQIEGFPELFKGRKKRPAELASSTAFFYLILRSAIDVYLDRTSPSNQNNIQTNVKIQLLTFTNFKKSASNNAMENRYHTTITMDTDGFDPKVEHLNSTQFSSVGPMSFFLPRKPKNSLCKILSREIRESRVVDLEDEGFNHWLVLFLKPNYEVIQYTPLINSSKEFIDLHDEVSIRFSDLTTSHMPSTNMDEILGLEKKIAMNYFARQALNASIGNWLYVPIQQEDLKLFYEQPEDVLNAAIYLRKFRGKLPYASRKTRVSPDEIRDLLTIRKVKFQLIEKSIGQGPSSGMYNAEWYS
jgi:hypothetical protein